VDSLAARPVLPGPAWPLGERRHPGKSLSGLLLRHRPGLRLLLHCLVLLMRCLPALLLLLGCLPRLLRHRLLERMPGLLLHRLLGCLPALRLLLVRLALLLLERLPRLGLLRRQELLGRQLL
jgi:hypothetical protein